MRAFNKNHRLGSRKYGHNYMYGYGYVYDMTSFENLGRMVTITCMGMGTYMTRQVLKT